MPKVQVSKEKYDQVRETEKASGLKINKHIMMVPDCVNGVWGAYKVKRCYKSLSRYFADMELVERADNEYQAEILTLKHMKALQRSL
jgi:hypothetical protein